MASGGGSFDDESVHTAVCPLQHRCGQGIRSNDGKKLGPGQRLEVTLHEFRRNKRHRGVVTLLCAGDVQSVRCRFMASQEIKRSRNLQRNARSHQDVANAS